MPRQRFTTDAMTLKNIELTQSQVWCVPGGGTLRRHAMICPEFIEQHFNVPKTAKTLWVTFSPSPSRDAVGVQFYREFAGQTFPGQWRIPGDEASRSMGLRGLYPNLQRNLELYGYSATSKVYVSVEYSGELP